MGNQSAAQYIQAPTRDAAGTVTNARPVAAKKAAPPTLKPLVAGKPNPNIGQGLKTSADLPQFGEQGWVNPNYDPNHNADGYHRFDPTIPGMGMQMSKDYAAGARTFDAYQKIAAGAPGSSLARDALTFMTDNGIDPARSNDIQKFAAMDYAGRHVQWKNQRPKRKFTIKQAFGTALSIAAIFAPGPWTAAALAASGSALQGGKLKDILSSAAIAGVGHSAGGKLGSAYKAGSTAAKTAATLGNVAKTAATVGVIGDSINKSGVFSTPTQNNALKGGKKEITTYEPENKNIALSAHPTSSYAAAYPGAPTNTQNSGSYVPPGRPAAYVPPPYIPPGRATTPYAPPAPYVAPTPVQVAPNIDIINYDPSRNYPQSQPNIDMVNYGPNGNSLQAMTMQQALMRPAATRAPASNATAA